jgi:hypothetical protein
MPSWGMSLSEAQRTGRFWRQGLAFFLIAGAITGLYAHFVPMPLDSGRRTADEPWPRGTIRPSVIRALFGDRMGFVIPTGGEQSRHDLPATGVGFVHRGRLQPGLRQILNASARRPLVVPKWW